MSNIIQSEVLQWKYTSCEFNIEGRSGFSTFSMSVGLTEEDKDDLVKFAGGYNAPDGLPPQPVTEEELDLFPIVLASFQLRSGKRAITRTRYVGKDYAGQRFGNIFSHGLILPEGTDWNFHPIQLWDNTRYSSIWTDALSEEEQHLGHTPEPLPVLDITDENLRRFDEDGIELLDHPVRFDWFKSLFAALCDTESNKNILLREEPDNAAKWIAALQYALPVSGSQKITFATYCRSASTAQLFHVAATCLEGHSFPFGSANLSTQFFPFDFAAESVEIHPKAKSRFTNLFSRYEHPSSETKPYFEFAKRYEIAVSPFDNSLAEVVLLYDFFVQPSCPLNDKEFKMMFGRYQKLPPETQCRILEDNPDFFNIRGDEKFLNRWSHLPLERLKIAVPSFERLIPSLSEKVRSSFVHWFIKQFDDNRNSGIFELFAKLQYRASYVKVWLSDTKHNTRDTDILNFFLKLITGLQEKEPKPLMSLLIEFIIRQFRLPLRHSDIKKNFDDLPHTVSLGDIEKLFMTNGWLTFGEQLLTHLAAHPHPDTLTFHFYLLITVHDEPLFGEHSEIIRNVLSALEPEQVKRFYESVLPAAINKADTFDKHRRIVQIFPESKIVFNDFASYYIKVLANHRYKTKNWLGGEKAEPQATAFLQYLFSGKQIFEQWTAIPDDGKSSVGQSKLVELFYLPRDMRGAVAISNEQCKEFRNNVLDILKEISPDSEMRQKFLRLIRLYPLRSKWQRNPFVLAGIAVIVITIIAVILWFTVGQGTNAPPSPPQNNKKETLTQEKSASENKDAK